MVGNSVSDQAKYPDLAPISSYGNGGFRFADMSHQGSLLLLPGGIYAWDVTDFSALTATDFELVFAHATNVDFLLLGCGPSLEMPAADIRQAFDDHNIGLEFMSTGAAVRTFNVLLAEKRAIAGAFIAVENP